MTPSWGDFGLTEADLAWHDDAACVGTDPDSFYPEQGPGITLDVAAAKRVCLRCPVRPNCLAYAIAHDERHGIWGGLTPQERRRHKAKTGPRRQDAEIGRLTRAGKSAREIACALAVTPRTVVRARARLRREEVA
ncbi:transcription factor WhiB [Amycolatopsis sp. RM579]|uniref:Transcriptional regulator WhiB n=1 Tax=Amycolatopsis pithecellobii TaxID=664692 RepID=A0A6N7ZAJ2_9PSEU|nr:transcription factor WhiB [Amycolatopsis pithecellobii]